MAVLQSAIYAVLSADAGVSALVGDRISPVLRRQEEAIPAITYQRISTQDWYAHDGAQNLSRVRVQFNCYGPTTLVAEQVADALRTAIEGGGTWGTVTVSACFRVGAQMDPAVEIDAWRRSDDYMITFVDD